VPVPAPPAPVPAPTMPKAPAPPPERPRPSSYANAAGAVTSAASSASAAAQRGANGNGSAAPRPRGPVTGPGAASGRGHPRPPVAAIVVPTEDFDFQKNLQKFNKPHIASDKAASGGYNKDDFFDNITTDKTDGGRRHNEQHTNVQTFGSLSITQAPPSLPTYQNRAPQGGRGAPPSGRGGDGGRGPAGGRTGGRGAGRGVDGQRRIPAPTSGVAAKRS
jgi:hypothetical protein